MNNGQSKGGIQQVKPGGWRWRLETEVNSKLTRVSGPLVATRQEAEAGLQKARNLVKPE